MSVPLQVAGWIRDVSQLKHVITAEWAHHSSEVLFVSMLQV